MDCPSCGTGMTEGHLVAESLLGGAKWTMRRTRLAVGGKPLVSPDSWGNVYLDGFRCEGCRTLVLRY